MGLQPSKDRARWSSPAERARVIRRRRLTFGLATVLAVLLVSAAVAGGGFAWLSLTFSKANSRPGVEEARKALEETFAPAPEKGDDANAEGSADPSAATTVPFVPPENPDAMNILLLGADRRPNEGGQYGRSDTMMVVHIDPEAGFLSVLSLPRDLRVDLGEHGVRKLNSAYALGGDALAIRAVHNVTGLSLSHFMTVDFAAFQKIIEKVGGVYVDVDRRYYDVGDVLLPIDIQPATNSSTARTPCAS